MTISTRRGKRKSEEGSGVAENGKPARGKPSAALSLAGRPKKRVRGKASERGPNRPKSAERSQVEVNRETVLEYPAGRSKRGARGKRSEEVPSRRKSAAHSDAAENGEPVVLESPAGRPRREARGKGREQILVAAADAVMNIAATCDLSICVSQAVERLRRHPVVLSKAVDDIANQVERSLRRPGDPAPSFLLIGGRGSGKDMIVRASLDRVRASCLDGPEFVEVHLHGMIHARSVFSFSRAISLALNQCCDADVVSLVNEKDCNVVVASCIEQLKKSGKGIVFVVSDFDRFAPAGSSHMVLYKILNFMQDAKLGCSFIGMTTHQDAVDGLEKRVKSRFLGREIAVTGFDDTSLDDVLAYLSEALTLPVPDASVVVSPREDGAESYAEHPSKTTADDGTVIEFNRITNEFLKSPSFHSALRRHLAGDRSAHRLAAAVGDTLLALVDRNKPPDWGARLSVADFSDVLGIPFTSVVDVLKGLSRLEMALVVALKRIEARREKSIAADSRTPIIFRQIYEEYAAIGTGGQRGHGENTADGDAFVDFSVASKAWGRLTEANIFALTGTGPKDFRRVSLMVLHHDVEVALAQHPDMSAFLRRWGKGALGATS
jgi:Cdc6-like AAA superfamily ATPase